MKSGGVHPDSNHPVKIEFQERERKRLLGCWWCDFQQWIVMPKALLFFLHYYYLYFIPSHAPSSCFTSILQFHSHPIHTCCRFRFLAFSPCLWRCWSCRATVNAQSRLQFRDCIMWVFKSVWLLYFGSEVFAFAWICVRFWMRLFWEASASVVVVAWFCTVLLVTGLLAVMDSLILKILPRWW